MRGVGKPKWLEGNKDREEEVKIKSVTARDRERLLERKRLRKKKMKTLEMNSEIKRDNF